MGVRNAFGLVVMVRLIGPCLSLFIVAICLTVTKGDEKVASHCVSHVECGDHAYCSPLLELCLCDRGFHQAVNRIDCVPSLPLKPSVRCEHDSQCYNVTGQCVSHVCTCREGFALDRNEIDCYRNRNQLTERCHQDSDCGDNTHCVNEQCFCKSGHVASANGIDCYSPVGSSKQRLGGYCQTSSECGLHTQCNSPSASQWSSCDADHICTPLICHCLPGYESNEDQINCWARDKCDSDLECGDHAYCDLNRVCHCNDGYVQQLGNGCQIPPSDTSLKVGVSVTVAIIILIIVFFVGCLRRYCRSLREPTPFRDNLNMQTTRQRVINNGPLESTNVVSQIESQNRNHGSAPHSITTRCRSVSPIQVPTYTQTIEFPGQDLASVNYPPHPDISPPPYSETDDMPTYSQVSLSPPRETSKLDFI